MTAPVLEGEILGSTEPRVYTPPLRELTPATSLGYAVIKFSQTILGIDPYPWQKWLYIHMLELNEDGTLRFKEVHILIARQNGKTRTMKTFLLWRLFVQQRKNLILGAAQNRLEALATWGDTREEAEENPTLSASMHRGSKKTGGETLRTRWGSRYMVVTLKDDAGRGKTAGTLFLDELRHHETWGPWSSLSSTTLVPRNSMIVTASNAGDARSVVLREKRDHAHGAILRGDTADDPVAIFEWSAPDGCDLDDVTAWAMANPSLGYGLTVKDLRAERSKPDNKFRTENLCQWVDLLESGIVPEKNWRAGMDRTSKRETGARASVSLDISWKRDKVAVAVAFDRPDGRRHVEVVLYTPSVDRAIRWLRDRLTLTNKEAKALGLPGAQTGREWFDGRVAIQGRGCPASSIADDLTAAGLTPVLLEGPALASSAGRFYDRVVSKEDPENPVIVHRGQPILDEAIRGTMAKTAGDSWFFDRKGSLTDASPLVACSQADWLHDQPVQEKRRSAYETGADFEML